LWESEEAGDGAQFDSKTDSAENLARGLTVTPDAAKRHQNA
jgi:hypothetical protein